MTEPEQPRRKTPTERSHEQLMAALDAFKSALTKSTVMHRESQTTTRNAKGDFQHEVVTYREDDEPDGDYDARHHARVSLLDEKFPLSRAQNFGRDYLPNEKGTK